MISRRLVQLTFWSCILIISWLLLAPASDLPPVRIWDKAAHTLAFAGLMLLGGLGHKHSLSLGWIALLLFFYGVGIEVVQHFLPTREFSLADMLANSLGIFLMLPFVTSLERLLKLQYP